MKKILIGFLVLLLLLGGLFVWKGGHHALALADTLEEWLDADDADQSVTLQVQIPGARKNGETGRIEPEVQQLSLTADTFWTEYADRPLFGLSIQGVSAYTDGKNLYMDTGKSYALPELRQTARELALGLLLHGRVTKSENTYHIALESDQLELYADFTAKRTLENAHIRILMPDGTAVQATVTPKETAAHSIPQSVLDAIVRSKMEPPMQLTEPLEVLLPALENLLPLTGDLTLGVECGILNLSETVTVRMDPEKAALERKGVTIDLPLPDIQPLPAALALLCSGDFTIGETGATVEITLPAETTGALCAALVPQIDALSMTFGESKAVLTVSGDEITSVTLTAEGEVPFLVTTIPVTFRGELRIR